MAKYTYTVWTQADGLRGDTVTAIAFDPGLTMVGTNYVVSMGTYAVTYGGVSIFTPLVQNRSWETYTPDDGLASNIIQAITLDEKVAWIGTDWGLNRFDTKTKSWDKYLKEQGLPDNSVNDVELQEGQVWVATAKGLAMLKEGSNALQTPDLSSLIDYNVLDMDFSGDVLWLATSRGGARVDVSSGSVTYYSTKNGMPSNQTTSVIAEDEMVWFGTSAGLAGLEVGTGTWQIRGEANGLPSDGIRVMAPDGNNIWIGTDKGIGVYDKNKDSSKSITTADGLPSNNIMALTIKGGRAWVGTDKGLVRINMQIPMSTIIMIAIAVIVLVGVAAYAFRGRLSRAMTPPKDRVAKKGKNPWQICGGNPKYQLCTKCRFLMVKGGGDFCDKYEKKIKIRDEGETVVRRKRSTGT